ncbi:hypothetical protein KAW55_08105 [bacterium]|nr:hypothetical protein [bacterium]
MPNGLFSTRDLPLACWLHYKSIKLVEVKPNGDGKVTFVFENPPEKENLVLEFYGGEPQVNARKFLDELRNLKAMTYNAGA